MHACIHTYIHTCSYMLYTDITTDSHTLYSSVYKYTCITYIHTSFQYFQISAFLEFPYYCKSGNMEICKFQKTEIMYACKQTCRCVGMYVFIYVSGWIWSRPSLKYHYPFMDQQAYGFINACLFVNTIQKEMDMMIGGFTFGDNNVWMHLLHFHKNLPFGDSGGLLYHCIPGI